ncbi:MAG: hypothetical protein AAGE01_17510 [Pseudomonadota bacterium]
MSETKVHPYLADKLNRMHPDMTLALAFVPDGRTLRLSCLLVLAEDLLGLHYGSREPEVRFNRVRWWHEEWGRLLAGAPRHPLTSGLAAAGTVREPHLNETLAFAASHDAEACADVDSLLAPAATIGRALGGVEAELHGNAEDAAAGRVGIWTEIVALELILALPRRLAAAEAGLPLTLTAELQVTRQAAIEDEPTARRIQERLLGDVAEAAGPVAGSDGWILRTLLRDRATRWTRSGREPRAFARLLRAWRAARQVRRSDLQG